VTTAAFIAIHEWIVHNCQGTLHIDAEVHFVDVLAPHRLADIALEFRLSTGGIQQVLACRASQEPQEPRGVILPI
jgi:hypothetical protein